MPCPLPPPQTTQRTVLERVPYLRAVTSSSLRHVFMLSNGKQGVPVVTLSGEASRCAWNEPPEPHTPAMAVLVPLVLSPLTFSPSRSPNRLAPKPTALKRAHHPKPLGLPARRRQVVSLLNLAAPHFFNNHLLIDSPARARYPWITHFVCSFL